MPIDRRSFLTTAALAGAAGWTRIGAQQPAAISPVPTPRDWNRTDPLQYPDPDIVALDNRFRRYIVANTAIKRLHFGTQWAEGPAWNAVGRYLVWSDIPNNVQMRWVEDDGRVTVFRNPSGYSNGNTFDFEGRQLSCEHGGRRVVRYEHNGTVTVIADKFAGKRLNSPNDIAVHPDGGIWFTDPIYGIRGNYEGFKGEQETVLFAPAGGRARFAGVGAVAMVALLAGQLSGVAVFDVTDTKGHASDRVLFSKWNSFSRIGVYERTHGDWSLSPTYTGALPDTRYMDIDSAASTPILHLEPDLGNVQYLRYELTALAYHLKEQRLEAGGSRLGGEPAPKTGASKSEGSASQPAAHSLQPPASSLQPPGFTALVIGPGGGRDLVSALVFGARQVDGVEINPIIADDVMRNRFREYSGGIYTHPRVRIVIDDGRSFVRRTPNHYDIIQASLVDTWAATAAGAYTLTENTLYTVEAFNDYLDHLNDDGVLTITRWVLDGLRLISLAQAACESRGWDAASRLAIVQHDRVATFLLKKTPFNASEVALLKSEADRLGFRVLYAPSINGAKPLIAADEWVDGVNTGVYAKLIGATNRAQFLDQHGDDISPTTDDRPFYFHTTKLKDQFQVAFGRSMLFGNGLSALLTLTGISAALVVLFVVGPLAVVGGPLPRGWFGWLAYFGALGAGFMLIEVSVLQRFVLLLGHPVYSLTVTLFSLLLGTGVGAAWSRRVKDEALARSASVALLLVAAVGVFVIAAVTPVISWAIPFARATRIAIAVGLLAPIGMLLGIPMPTGLRLLQARAPEMVTWAWGINGALSVLGATLAIFIAMNWGFRATLLAASTTYLMGFVALRAATSR